MTPETAEQSTAPYDWENPSSPTDLIFDDGEPLESNRHRIAMNVLIRSTHDPFDSAGAAVELLSPSTAAVDKGTKKNLYEQVFKTRDYFVFDPFAADSLQG